MKTSKLLPNPKRSHRSLLTVNQHRRYPTFMYKYRRGDEPYLRSLIVDNELYLASRESFNDPMDVSYSVLPSATPQLRREYLYRISKGNFQARQKLLRKINTPEEEVAMRKKLLDEIADKMGVFSFSETARNLLMWAHYANNHSGICLQYYIPAHPDFARLLLSVNYVEDLVVITPQNQRDTLVAAFTSKSTDWRYEEEWRIVQPDAAGGKMNLPAEMLVGVIYGARCTPAIKNNVRKLIQERVAKGQPPLYEYQAKLSTGFYHMGIFSESKAPQGWKGRRGTRESYANKKQIPRDLRVQQR